MPRPRVPPIGDARPDTVIHTAAFVGGIGDKTARPLPYLLDNLRIDASVLDAVRRRGGAAAISTRPVGGRLPGRGAQPHPGERAVRRPPGARQRGLRPRQDRRAQRRGVRGARRPGRAYRAILPSNLYGPGDTSIRSARTSSRRRSSRPTTARDAGVRDVEVWGDGTARREFTYAPDLADWLVDAIDAPRRVAGRS